MSALLKTYTATPADTRRGWRVIDAADKPLGRVASQISAVLRGKDKTNYSPFQNNGDNVIVVNAAKVRVTGAKSQEKVYYWHSNYPGGFKSVNFEKMLATHPDRIIELAVWGMLPKNRLGRAMLRKLKVYKGPNHPHGAQIKELAAPEKAGRPRKDVARKPKASATAAAGAEGPPAKTQAASPEPKAEAAPAKAAAPAQTATQAEPIKKTPAQPRSRKARAAEAPQNEGAAAPTAEQPQTKEKEA
jgi:large subunit ribosomal protein L13